MDTFNCEGCDIELTHDSLVPPDDVAEHDLHNLPWACPECGAAQWESGDF